MKYLKNKCFQRGLRDNGLDDADIRRVLDDILKGRAIPLGAKMYKIRGAGDGKGKSGGFRNIFFWKRDERIVFCLLFAKNEKDNLSSGEKKALKILSDEYDRLTEEELKGCIRNNTLMEIDYDG